MAIAPPLAAWQFRMVTPSTELRTGSSTPVPSKLKARSAPPQSTTVTAAPSREARRSAGVVGGDTAMPRLAAPA